MAPTTKDSRAIRWCFTLNNPADFGADSFCKDFDNKVKRGVFGTEIGKKGTPHIQGY